MNKLKEISEGWLNYAKQQLGVLDAETGKLAEKRLAICANCKIRTGNKCDSTKAGISKYNKYTYGCGCPLIPKSLSPSSTCPLGYWESNFPSWQKESENIGVRFVDKFQNDINSTASVEELTKLIKQHLPYDSISE